MSWRDDKPTEAQLKAIVNKATGFNISFNCNITTKGQAFDEIQRLNSVIAALPKRSFNGFNGNMYQEIDLYPSIGDWGSQ